MALAAPWVRHLKDPESRLKFEQTVRASFTALSRLYDLLEEEEKAILSQETSIDDFANADWAFKQAYRNGRKAQIKELKQLLGFVKDQR